MEHSVGITPGSAAAEGGRVSAANELEPFVRRRYLDYLKSLDH